MKNTYCPTDIGFINTFDGEDCKAEQWYNGCYHCWSTALAKEKSYDDKSEIAQIAQCFKNISVRMMVKNNEGENEIMTDYLINGLDIVISKNLVKGYVQTRKHHKRRINKKWIKRYGSKPIYDMNYYLIDGKIYMSPKAFEALNIKKEIIK